MDDLDKIKGEANSYLASGSSTHDERTRSLIALAIVALAERLERLTEQLKKSDES